jgi:hypothetical protein
MMVDVAAARSPQRRLLAAAALLAAAVVGSGSGPGPGSTVQLHPDPPDRVAQVIDAQVTVARLREAIAAPTAQQALGRLPVKGRAAKTGYSRSRFGDGWADADNDGCSTRAEILQRDLTRKTFRPSRPCAFVATGLLTDPYSGRAIAFRRGPRTSGLIQIDHVVALADAWRKGAQALTPAQRDAFANDPLNLLPVDARLNQLKSASDAASWLPSDKRFRCRYVALQVAVKARYGLWITVAEKAAITAILQTCPEQPLPAD